MSLKLFKSQEKTSIAWCENPEDVFVSFDSKFKDKLVPVLSFSSTEIYPKSPKIPIHFVHHDVGIDAIYFKIENGKYNIAEIKGELRPIEGLSDSWNNKMYLKTKAEPEFVPHRLLTYNEHACLIHDDDLNSVLKRYKKLIWNDHFLQKVEYYNGVLNVVETEKVISYDEKQQRYKVEIFRLEKSFELTENFMYQTDAKGNITITKDTNKSFHIKYWANKKLLQLNGQQGIQFAEEPSSEELFNKIVDFAKLNHYADTSINQAILNSFDEEATIEIQVEKTDNFELKSIRYHYNQKPYLVETEYYQCVENKNHLRLEYLNADLEMKHYFEIMPNSKGYIADLYKDSELNYTYEFEAHTQDEAILATIEGNLPLFHKKSDKEKVIKQPFAYEFSLYPNGKVHKIHVSVMKNSPSSMAEILTDKKIPWLQQDQTPKNSKGKKMKYLACLKSGHLFGYYYLFFDEQDNQVVQIFQCT